MQDCFRQHPETYASEFEDDEEEVEDELRARDTVDTKEVSPTPESETATSSESSQKVAPEATQTKPAVETHLDNSDASASNMKVPVDEAEHYVPKAAYDAVSK